MGKISRAGGPTVEGVPGLDHQSDREEDQDRPGEVEGGVPDRATRIEQAAQPETEEQRAEREQREQEQGDQQDGDQQNLDRGDELAGAIQGSDPQATADDQDAETYEGWSYGEVQAECKERRLPASGSHVDLVNRLIEDDRKNKQG